MATPPTAPAPSWAELATLLAAMGGRATPAAPPPPPERESSTTRWILAAAGSLAVVFLGGLGTYAGSTIAGVGQIGVKMDGLKGSVEDLKKTVDAISTQTNQQQLIIGKQDLRLGTLEQNQARLMDRMRAVEGGPRIYAPALGTAPGAP